MKKSNSEISEQKCPACNGTGFPAVKRLAKPGRKIYPPPCKKCKGMGRIKVAAHRTGSRPLRKSSAAHGLAAFR